ncbi:MAG: ACT domain-containing protein, partial [Gammaproteobacteria bacterium]
GVSVHRSDCAKLAALAGLSPGRLIEVSWQAGNARPRPASVRVIARDRPGLLRDLVTLLGNERINVLDLGSTVDRTRHTATVRLTLEIGSLVDLARTLDRIQRVDGVLSAIRHAD